MKLRFLAVLEGTKFRVCKYRVCKYRVLSGKTGTKMDGDNEKLHNLYYWNTDMGDKMLGHAASMRKMRTTHKALPNKPKHKRSLETTR
jgi:hypothetical protein